MRLTLNNILKHFNTPIFDWIESILIDKDKIITRIVKNINSRDIL